MRKDSEHKCCLVTVQTYFKELEELIQEFQELFEEPKALPPKRVYDYSIPTIPRAQPVIKRPYRYSIGQKNSIEEMMDEMLKTCVIIRVYPHLPLLFCWFQRKIIPRGFALIVEH